MAATTGLSDLSGLSSVFLQVHLVLGLLLGPLADRAFNQARGPAIAVAAALAAGTEAFWLIRRRRRGASAAWTEASCPACVGVTFLSDRVPAVIPRATAVPAAARRPLR